MVIACPHALGLAVPLVVAVSTALSARRGLLIRDRTAFERARELDAVVFDKTGTLTEGRFGVTDVVALDGHNEREVLRLAAALESRSEHPIAAGIARAAADRGARRGSRGWRSRGRWWCTCSRTGTSSAPSRLRISSARSRGMRSSDSRRWGSKR